MFSSGREVPCGHRLGTERGGEETSIGLLQDEQEFGQGRGGHSKQPENVLKNANERDSGKEAACEWPGCGWGDMNLGTTSRA